VVVVNAVRRAARVSFRAPTCRVPTPFPGNDTSGAMLLKEWGGGWGGGGGRDPDLTCVSGSQRL